MHGRAILNSLLVLSFLIASAQAAVFQYRVTVKTDKEERAAFLWLPPEAKHVRGVVMAGMTLMEQHFVRDPQVRAACVEQSLAIVFLQTGLQSTDVLKVLEDFATESGYQELKVAPLFFVGHSAGGPQAKALAIRYADRCFGVMQFRGGVPGNKTNPGDRVPPGVPALAMVGQFDEFGGRMRDENGQENAWEMGRDGLLDYRGSDAGHLGSIVVEPGAGHFAWSERNAAYFALFLKKAAAARIPDWPVDATEPVKCKPVDPSTGWLTDLTVKTFDQAEPRSWNDYSGDRAKAQWHFDKEIAEANVAFHRGMTKKDQFIKWNHDIFLDAGVRYFIQDLKWTEPGDVLTFKMAYADTYPAMQPNGPRWADAGKPAANSGKPIKLRVAAGPIEVFEGSKLRLRFDALNPPSAGARATFLAYSEGDDTFRYTEQVGMLPRGFKGIGGPNQTVTFPAPTNMIVGDAAQALGATSSSELPVQYYVAVGPAEVVDGKLVLKDVPVRAKMPITIKVVAYQPGSATGAKKFATSAGVEQAITVSR